MNKEKAELYARLYARAFLITETAENLHYENNSKPHEDEYSEIYEFSADILDKIQKKAEEDLTKEELEYYEELTDSPNRYQYE